MADLDERLQEHVNTANAKAGTERLHISQHERKRRRRSGGAGGAAAAAAAQGLLAARPAMDRAHAATQAVRAAVDAAKSTALQLVLPARLADLKEARNEGCSELVRLMGRVDVGGSNHVVIMGFLSVASLWQLRGISRVFRRWSSQQLSRMARIV